VTDSREHLRAPIHGLDSETVVTIRVDWIRAALADSEKVIPITKPDTSWRARLWVVPCDTMLPVREAAEALGKSPSAVHKLASRHRIPFFRASADTLP
jgi:hypothetical protein